MRFDFHNIVYIGMNDFFYAQDEIRKILQGEVLACDYEEKEFQVASVNSSNTMYLQEASASFHQGTASINRQQRGDQHNLPSSSIIGSHE